MMSRIGELVKDNITGEYKHIFNHIGCFDVYLEDVLKIFPDERDAIIHNYEQDEVFDVYGDYLFPTETVLEKPNIISGAFVF